MHGAAPRDPPIFPVRRIVTTAAVATIVALGCGPSVKTIQGPNPGASSSSFLLATTPRMVVEVTPTPNHLPSPDALALLVQRIGEHVNKPAGVGLVVDDPVPTTSTPGVRHLWTWNELMAFEQANVTQHASPGTIVLNAIYLDGTYGPNPEAIAISYTDHSFAYFSDMIQPGGPEGPALVHEFGHEMGLVNGTTKELTPHEDAARTLHDVSPQCVMFFSLNPTANPFTPTDYCDLCKADLRAVGSK